MAKPTMKTWLHGTVLAVGAWGATPAAAEYAVYPPQDNGYRLQRASYQQPQAWNDNISLPPQIQPYDPNSQYGQAQQYGQPQSYGQYPQNNAQVPQNNLRYPRPAPQNDYQVFQNQDWQANRPVPAPARLSAERRAILDAAYRAIGTTYVWGGNSPREGFDCSGLTRFTHKKAQHSIPRTAAEQSKASRTISRNQLRPGDMIFFKTSGSQVNHVGIYVGNGNFIHAASGGGKVTLDDLRKNYWQQRLVKYGTFLA